jgi:hypothetical protein
MMSPLLSLVLPIGAQLALVAVICFAFTGTASVPPIPKDKKSYAKKKSYAGEEPSKNLIMHRFPFLNKNIIARLLLFRQILIFDDHTK